MGIENRMKFFNVYKYGETLDEYGQKVTRNLLQGQIRMNLMLNSQNNTEDKLYTDSKYIGLTRYNLDTDCLLENNGKFYKVKYINSLGRTFK